MKHCLAKVPHGELMLLDVAVHGRDALDGNATIFVPRDHYRWAC